jgi:hypothetical protein
MQTVLGLAVDRGMRITLPMLLMASPGMATERSICRTILPSCDRPGHSGR